LIVRVTIPARINILGNPTDGNEGDFYTISSAVNIYGGAVIEPADTLTFRYTDGPAMNRTRTWATIKSIDEIFDWPYDSCTLFAAALRGLIKFHEPMRRMLDEHPIRASLWTKVPKQSGLGGSSVLVLALLNALRVYYDIDCRLLHDYALAELAQRVEEIEMGVTCGYSDRYVPQLGGLAYIDYRDKLEHRSMDDEPLATYERLDAFIAPLTFVVGFSGVSRNSGNVHSVMRERYLDDWRRQQREPAYASSIIDRFRAIAETARRGKVCLMRGELEPFGALMNENHDLIDAIMHDCGFSDGAGAANNQLISAARDAGALGAKLSGAGGGGSVLVLPKPSDTRRMLDVLRAAAHEHQMRGARFFTVRVVRHGPRVKVEGRP
jgi:galactokinase/mevalonate kinase-like predicted kinase